jgi:hypothetical protein
LEERTGHGLAEWNRRVAQSGAETEEALRAWLEAQGVSGHPQSLLVMERYGYPEFLTVSADELMEGQYADRPDLRPVLDAIIVLVSGLPGAHVQARKTKISLMTPKRKFAEVAPTTKTRVDLFLRLDGEQPSGRLIDAAPRQGDVMNLKVGLATPDQVDAEVEAALHRAFGANC